MNNRLFHEVATDSLKEEVLSNGVLSLVRELNHSYGLKVYNKTYHNGYNGYSMCNDEGLPIAKVFMDDETYCYHAPYQAKSRGSDEFDRHTYRSKKLSTLMATLKKANIVTTTDRVLAHYNRRMNQVIALVSRSFEDRGKDSMSASHAQRLLQAMVDGKGLDSFSQSDRDLYLQLLDNYKTIDTMKVVKKEGIESMFSDCYLVMCDSNSQYVIGETTYEYATSASYVGTQMSIKPTTKFKRVADLSEYPKILSTLTMLKVHLGESFKPYALSNQDKCSFPLGDKYIPDLELVYAYEGRSMSDFDMGYLCLAK